MVTINTDFQKALDALKDPEIAKDWADFAKFVKSFRAHIFLGGIATTGIGLFTTVYAMTKMGNSGHAIPVGIAGLVTTILGVGITVDTGAHLYYG